MAGKSHRPSPAEQLIHDMRNSLAAMNYALRMLPIVRQDAQEFARAFELLKQRVDEMKAALDDASERAVDDDFCKSDQDPKPA